VPADLKAEAQPAAGRRLDSQPPHDPPWALSPARDGGLALRVSISYPLPGDRFLLAPRAEVSG